MRKSRRWVISGKAQTEHNISALPLKATIGADIVFIRSVPDSEFGPAIRWLRT